MTSRYRQIVTRSAGFFLCILLLVHARFHLDRYRSPEQMLQESVNLPPGEILRTISLGYQSVLADLLWMKTVIYFGKRTLDEDNPYVEIVRKKVQDLGHGAGLRGRTSTSGPQKWQGSSGNSTQDAPEWDFDPKLHDILFAFPSRGLAPYLYPLLWRVVKLDPHFLYPYEFGGVVALMNTGEIREALRLLVHGYQHNPDRWELPFYLAFIELFYLGNREQALRFLAQTLSFPDHPESVQQLFVSLARHADNRNVVASTLRSLYESSGNPAFKQQILKLARELTANPP